MKKLIFTVTNDLNYDQRMIRICNSLTENGYDVTLVGYTLKDSVKLHQRPFKQKRVFTIFRTGKLFYIEYNLRLLFYLLFKKADLICAIDLDTILPVLIASKIKGSRRVYDAHELFCEMKEIVSRPFIYKIWKSTERFAVPKFKYGYTVNEPIANEFEKMYGVSYPVIMNAPFFKELVIPEKSEKYILYQGAVNEGRSFETLIPAMKSVAAKLVIAGSGNYIDDAKKLVNEWGLQDKIVFKGRMLPEELFQVTIKAWIGVTLFEPGALSNYFSLANRYFDYMHAGVPQLCVNYPVYAALNKTKPVAVLTDNLTSENLAQLLNHLLENSVLYNTLQENCLEQRKTLNWQREEKKLIDFYKKIFSE
jgi:glycosyltransferase involved in cell wall biosynthesis